MNDIETIKPQEIIDFGAHASGMMGGSLVYSNDSHSHSFPLKLIPILSETH
jgi:hypothetical protein